MNPQRLIGTIMLAVAALLAIATVWITWSGWWRWVGISHIAAARSRLVEANDDTVRRHAADAADALPNEPAAVLLGIDLAKESEYGRLQGLERRASPQQRELVQVAEALSLVLRSQPASEVPGADGVLLKTLEGLMRGVKPAPITLPRESPPHQAVLVATYLAQLRAAFAVKDRGLLRETAGSLNLLVPKHPESPSLTFICAALDPAYPAKDLASLAEIVRDKGQLQQLAKRLAVIAPDRALILDTVARVSPTATPAQTLEAQVKAAVSKSDAVDLIALIRRCFDAQRPDLVKLVLPKLSADIQAGYRTLALNQEGNVADLARIGAEEAVLSPRLAPPRCRPGLIAFHLSNDLGLVPKTALMIYIDRAQVPAEAITRIGTLYSIETSYSGPVDLQVKAGDFTLFSGTVTL